MVVEPEQPKHPSIAMAALSPFLLCNATRPRRSHNVPVPRTSSDQPFASITPDPHTSMPSGACHHNAERLESTYSSPQFPNSKSPHHGAMHPRRPNRALGLWRVPTKRLCHLLNVIRLTSGHPDCGFTSQGLGFPARFVGKACSACRPRFTVRFAISFIKARDLTCLRRGSVEGHPTTFHTYFIFESP